MEQRDIDYTAAQLAAVARVSVRTVRTRLGQLVRHEARSWWRVDAHTAARLLADIQSDQSRIQERRQRAIETRAPRNDSDRAGNASGF